MEPTTPQTPDRSLLDRLRGVNSTEDQTTDATLEGAEPAAEPGVAPAAPEPDWKTNPNCVNCGNSLNSEDVCDQCGYDKKLMVESNYKN